MPEILESADADKDVSIEKSETSGSTTSKITSNKKKKSKTKTKSKSLKITKKDKEKLKEVQSKVHKLYVYTPSDRFSDFPEYKDLFEYHHQKGPNNTDWNILNYIGKDKDKLNKCLKMI